MYIVNCIVFRLQQLKSEHLKMQAKCGKKLSSYPSLWSINYNTAKIHGRAVEARASQSLMAAG